MFNKIIINCDSMGKVVFNSKDAQEYFFNALSNLDKINDIDITTLELQKIIRCNLRKRIKEMEISDEAYRNLLKILYLGINNLCIIDNAELKNE